MDAVTFASTVRLLAGEARAHGLVVPSFRSPPRDPVADRSLRRREDHTVVLAVRIRDRERAAIVADLVDGLLAANGVADQALRQQLLEALGGDGGWGAPPACPSPSA